MITACWSALALAAAVKVLTSGHLLTMRSPAGTALLSSIILAVSSACVSQLHASSAMVGRSWNAHQFCSVEQLLMCSKLTDAGICGQLVFWFILHSLHISTVLRWDLISIGQHKPCTNFQSNPLFPSSRLTGK